MEPDRAPEKKEGRAPVVFGGARLARARSAAGAALTAAAASDPPLQVGAVAYPLGFGTGFCQNYEFTSWSALRGAGATPQLPNPLYKQQNQQQQGSGQIADDDWTMLVYRPGAPPAEPTLTPQQQQQQQERRAKLIPDFYPVPADPVEEQLNRASVASGYVWESRIAETSSLSLDSRISRAKRSEMRKFVTTRLRARHATLQQQSSNQSNRGMLYQSNDMNSQNSLPSPPASTAAAPFLASAFSPFASSASAGTPFHRSASSGPSAFASHNNNSHD